MMIFTPEKEALLGTHANVLVLGGPGSGKTTIALLKANHEIRAGQLREKQKILFLSFARATVARVRQRAADSNIISAEAIQQLEVATYHGFAWSLLRSHGYLLNSRRAQRLISPPDAASMLADFEPRSAERAAEIRRMFYEDGLLHFDLFADCAAELLARSKMLSNVICDAYPVIVLDEFQDTNASEWKMIQSLSKSRLIALADPDQRIYEFRGADPSRISEFSAAFHPAIYDFGAENHRSGDTDIALFGADLINGTNKGRIYSDVSVKLYEIRRNVNPDFNLKFEILKARKRLQERLESEWSIGVLVPTNQLMMQVSEFIGDVQNLGNGTRIVPGIAHDVAFDTAGPALAAGLIGCALERGASESEIASRLLLGLKGHIRGRRGGEKVSKAQLDLALSIGAYVESGSIRGKKRRALVDDCITVARTLMSVDLTGDPGRDWLSAIEAFARSSCTELKQVASDARLLRLMHRGSALRSRLGETWRSSRSYAGAEAAVKGALLQEHFANSVRDWRGVHVMTMHKSKGKEFDEVVIYEGLHRHRIVNPTDSESRKLERRRNLMVAVTRAKSRTQILTPRVAPCEFL